MLSRHRSSSSSNLRISPCLPYAVAPGGHWRLSNTQDRSPKLRASGSRTNNSPPPSPPAQSATARHVHKTTPRSPRPQRTKHHKHHPLPPPPHPAYPPAPPTAPQQTTSPRAGWPINPSSSKQPRKRRSTGRAHSTASPPSPSPKK